MFSRTWLSVSTLKLFCFSTLPVAVLNVPTSSRLPCHPADISKGTLAFEEYQLILLLIAALAFAALIHPRETWVLGHGVSYLLGFPAMQILLPIYAVCNIVDQSWGTRDTVSDEPRVRNLLKYPYENSVKIRTC